MNTGRLIGGGIVAGGVFYLLSLGVWAVLKFLPVVPLPIAIPPQGLGAGWQVQHLVASLVIGLFWAVGYGIYGKARAGGWLYGLIMFVAILLPTFAVNFFVNPAARSLIAYGAVVSLVGALLGGKSVAWIAQR